MLINGRCREKYERCNLCAFEEDEEPRVPEQLQLLRPIKDDHYYLYKIGCMLQNNMKKGGSIDILISDPDGASNTGYCGFLNDWSYKKNIIYIN
ncbi:hypothetical protein PMALA_082110 [Plasmodium malariae]|uniref:Uncharacterized protein n=1 Tax=Plasmodium malariae TaxID=5858 RepID=A0A1A8XB79_PLAMA|nr:hypothetical protein PMALA_082110 [Plasmodium malariae]